MPCHTHKETISVNADSEQGISNQTRLVAWPRSQASMGSLLQNQRITKERAQETELLSCSVIRDVCSVWVKGWFLLLSSLIWEVLSLVITNQKYVYPINSLYMRQLLQFTLKTWIAQVHSAWDLLCYSEDSWEVRLSLAEWKTHRDRGLKQKAGYFCFG